MLLNIITCTVAMIIGVVGIIATELVFPKKEDAIDKFMSA